MIRAVIFTAVGYWLSRQYYERFDLVQRQQREADISSRLNRLLAGYGLTEEEVSAAKKEILQ